MLPITRLISPYNHSAPNNIQYLVIHDVGSDSSALANAKYFYAANRGSSAHLFIDDTSIYQVVEFAEGAWHCGDGGMAYGIGNHNSIGIEMCRSGGTVTSTTEANTIEAVKYLMAKYNIPLSRVVRHYDASRKLCPGSMAANNWAAWYAFKSKISSNVVLATAPSSSGQIYRVRTAYNNVASQIGAYTDLANAKACVDAHPGYVVYDSNFNQVYPSVASAPAVQYGTVTASVLNVRRSGSISAEIIGTLSKGQRVKIDRIAGDWVSIYFGDHGGYVSKSYLSIS